MRTRRIGSLEVSEVGVGCNNFGARLDATGTTAVVAAALDVGITFFDTADIYGGTESEVLLGTALGPMRDRVVVATKFGMPIDDQRKGAAPEYVKQAIEDSLRRLGTDHVDLYQLHAPDEATPIADTLGVLDELVRQGKAREIGCSNFTVAQLEEAAAAVSVGAAGFASVQNQYSLLYREPEDGVLPFCSTQGMAFLPYYPLASGLLSGKYQVGRAPAGTRLAGYPAERTNAWLAQRNLDAVDALARFAKERGHSVLDLAVAWLLSHGPLSSVIAGAMTPAQVHANAAASGWVLPEDDLALLDQLLAALAG
jgi:aryl-alcohol dehydrogenase-like predicted oxidoreductase